MEALELYSNLRNLGESVIKTSIWLTIKSALVISIGQIHCFSLGLPEQLFRDFLTYLI